jgi:molecular chaperone DnaK
MVGRPDGSIARIRDPLRTRGQVVYQIPTAVCIRDDGSLAVGTSAERMKLSRPGRYRSEFKADFGGGPMAIGSRWYESVELAAEVLKFLRTLAEQEFGPPEKIICTIPATWAAGKQDLMLSAAELAGFERQAVTVAQEPAAAIAYAFSRLEVPDQERRLLVYDLGGGTFDCAVVAMTPNGYYPLDADGLADVGGVAFNMVIRDLIREHYPDAVAEILDGPDGDENLRRRMNLRDSCERIKLALSVKSRHKEMLTALRPAGTLFELSRSELEDRIAPLLASTFSVCEKMLERCELAWKDIDLVVPVGGSSHIPAVGKQLAARSWCTVLRVPEPDLAVVQGAVMLARRGLPRHGRPTARRPHLADRGPGRRERSTRWP